MPRTGGGQSKRYQTLVLCCGHMDRGDDSMGPLCAAALEERGVPARTLAGGSSELLEAFRAAERLIVVDAIASGLEPAGTLHCAESAQGHFEPRWARCSATGGGLMQACHLARQMHMMPERLYLVGIEAAGFGWSATLSPEVAASMPALVEAVTRLWNELTAPERAQARHAAPGRG